jgi:putative flippase GtrA
MLSLKKIYIKLFTYELGRFLIIGGATVIIDLIAYLLLINIPFDTGISKGISFSVGAVFAYFSNRKFTFRSTIVGPYNFTIFVLLYLSTLGINVVTNEAILNYAGRTEVWLSIAFLSATLLSATLNFIGMKYIIFAENKGIQT